MRAFLVLLLSLLITAEDFRHEKFTRTLPEGWAYKTKKDVLTISRKEKVRTYFCGYNSPAWIDTILFAYVITIDRVKKLSEQKVERRHYLRDSILNALEMKYKTKPDRTNAGAVMYFNDRKDKIDSLRLPFYADEQYSYFIQDNLSSVDCYADEKIREEIEKVYSTIRKVR